MIDFLKEYLVFLKKRKKLLLLPISLLLFVIGGLLFLSTGSVVSPFIYTLF